MLNGHCVVYSAVSTRNTYIQKYISHLILERGTQFVVSLRDRWRHILREETSSCPISSSRSEGVAMLSPPCKPYRQRRPRRLWSAAYLRLDSRFSGFCQNLTAWFSYHMVSFRLHTSSTGLFTNHNVTACQSTRGHLERTENPCHMFFNNWRDDKTFIYKNIFIFFITKGSKWLQVRQGDKETKRHMENCYHWHCIGDRHS